MISAVCGRNGSMDEADSPPSPSAPEASTADAAASEKAMTCGPFCSEEREDETDEREHLGEGEAQEREGAQDAVGLGLAGDTVDVRREDQADTDTGADRSEREDQRPTEGEGRFSHEMYRFPFRLLLG